MIRISRDRTDQNGNPIRPSDQWFDGAKKATTLAIQEMGDHEADSKIYAHGQVRIALEELFHEKCAYCRKPTEDTDWEVEHFRPKKRVAERGNHPGYYWLAYKWENLYPSCERCNQHRRDKPRWGNRRYGRAGGKADQFPLMDEANRAMSHDDDVGLERPLLIDPCGNDDPERHLDYDVKGEIYPRRGSVLGRATIDVLNLNRSRLHKPRAKLIKQTVYWLKILRKSKSKGDREAEQDAKKTIDEFCIADDCQYAGAARAVQRDPDNFGV